MIIKEKFILSHSLLNHPVKNEKSKYKIKYLIVLEYFISKYSKDDSIALGMMENYKNEFLGSQVKPEGHANSINNYLKNVMSCRWSFKKFKLITYKYCLLCDVLMMNAFGNAEKAQLILDEIKGMCNGNAHKKFEQLFGCLYDKSDNTDGLDLATYLIDCWRKNADFITMPEKRVLITANMSAGKSTLINALVGKVVNRTMNDTCTSKIHYIYDQAYEDNFTHEWDYEINLNADIKALMEDDKRNTSNTISVATCFRMMPTKDCRLCIIDTPGVNTATSKEHGELTKKCVFSEQYDLLVFVINAENAGTDDDYKYLSFIKENVAQDKIIFVLNKLDNFKKSEDSIEGSVINLENDLKELGFSDPVICPVSCYAGLLVKMANSGEHFNSSQSRQYDLLNDIFDDEFYDLSRFYNSNNGSNDILQKCGILGLEQIILEKESGK